MRGNPPDVLRNLSRQGVYPRVCGGTHLQAWREGGEQGLSPRVRGNPDTKALSLATEGSIPACAGEPTFTTATYRLGWVYPRVCGGTFEARAPEGIRGGLSPRVRGNPRIGPFAVLFEGSIPACAGEPRIEAGTSSLSRVYPRVCGGTARCPACKALRMGLSPRVRGNHASIRSACVFMGSIPACAGEPARHAARSLTARVYPRVCGGTVLDYRLLRLHKGLSPRVRGNLQRRVDPCAHNGSIPACAGEPLSNI